MAYKVLTDGNGSKLIRVVGMGDYMPLSDYKKIEAERDSLIEQINTFNKAFNIGIECDLSCEELKDSIAKAAEKQREVGE